MPWPPVRNRRNMLSDFSRRTYTAIPAIPMWASSQTRHEKRFNCYIYYCTTFSSHYPEVHRAIGTRSANRGRITGACWQHESPFVRAECETAVAVSRTPAQTKLLHQKRLRSHKLRYRDRAQTGADRLKGIDAAVFDLWLNGASRAAINTTSL